MNLISVRGALAVALCICTGAPAQDAQRRKEDPDLWVALPYPADEASYGRILKAAWQFGRCNKGVSLRISLVADDPRELSEEGLFALGRAIQAVAPGLEVSLFDTELVEKLAAWGIKRLPAFALVKDGRAHLCHSAGSLEELTECEK
jgi:hypothetical protein